MMYTNFRIELAKLFSIVAIGIVLLSGLTAHLVISTLIIRILIGGGLFAVVGYLLGRVIDQQKEVQLVELQKQKIKAKIRANYGQVTKSGNKMEDDFSAMEVDKLTKIIVDSMDD